MTEQSPPPNTQRLDRAIILQLLSEEEQQRSSTAELADALGAPAPELEHALSRLCEAGVVCVDGTQVWASPAAQRIDELGLIGI